MTDYYDGKWHAWDKDECPVEKKDKVRVVGKYAGEHGREYSAGALPWGDVVAFRVIERAPELARGSVDE